MVVIFVFVVGLMVLCVSLCLAYVMLWLLLIWLQYRCASLQLRYSYGLPPNETGIISSISGLSGCGVLSVLLTGLPQIQQMFWVASIRALSLRRLFPFAFLGLVVGMVVCYSFPLFLCMYALASLLSLGLSVYGYA